MNKVKVGQVWALSEKCEAEIIHVIGVDVCCMVESCLMLLDESDFLGARLVSDMSASLSDLEIVQKALSKSGAVLTMYLDGSGNVNSLIDEDENILSFSKAKELLTWAKQTLEQ